MKLTTAVLIIICLASCNDEAKKEPQEEIQSFDYKTPDGNVTAADIEKKRAIDSTRFASLGGLDTLKMDYTTKCNLTKGYYATTKQIKDSSDLAFLTKYKSDELFQSSHRDGDCPYPVMTAVYVYESKKVFKKYEGLWISNCIVTPSNMDGEVSVNKYYLDSDTLMYSGGK